MSASVLQETASALNSGSVSSVAVQFANNCTPGSTIEVWIGNDSAVSISSVSDGVNSGNYTAGASATGQASGDWNQYLYYYVNQSSSTKLTVTVDFASSASYTGVIIKEIGGVSSSPYQTSVMAQQADPGAGAGAIASPSITPTSEPCLMSSMTFDFAAAAATTAANGTQGQQCWSFDSINAATTQSQLLSSTSPTTATFTNATDGTSHYFITGAVIWTQASGGASLPAGSILT